MKISKQARREAKEVFRACIVNGRLDEDRVRGIVRKVVEAKPRGYVAILSQFQRLVRLELERRTARIESAVTLPAPLQSDLKQKLERLYGAGLNISFAVNPGLLGGLRVRVGSDVYDGSVQWRLERLAESFSSET